MGIENDILLLKDHPFGLAELDDTAFIFKEIMIELILKKFILVASIFKEMML
jgi:hypothetical protein